MGFGRDLLDRALGLGLRAASEARRLASHVRVDGRRVFLSDAALCGSVEAIARALAPDVDLRLAPAPEGYLARAVAGGAPVSALLVLERLRFAHGTLRVEVATPRGVDLASRPLAAFVAAAVARLFGGTWVGRRLLALALPDGIVWDGKRGSLEVALGAAPLVGAHLREIDATAVATHAGGGLWLELDRDGIVEDVVAVVLKGAATWLAPPRP